MCCIQQAIASVKVRPPSHHSPPLLINGRSAAAGIRSVFKRLSFCPKQTVQNPLADKLRAKVRGSCVYLRLLLLLRLLLPLCKESIYMCMWVCVLRERREQRVYCFSPFFPPFFFFFCFLVVPYLLFIHYHRTTLICTRSQCCSALHYKNLLLSSYIYIYMCVFLCVCVRV